MRRYPTSEKSDLYEFKMELFDNGDTEEFLMFIHNSQITLGVSGTLGASAKIQYLHTLLLGETLCQLGMLSVEVVSMTTTHLNRIFRYVIFPINVLSNKKCAIIRGISNPRELKFRSYASCMINLNEYLAVFPVSKTSGELVRRKRMKLF